MATSILAPGTTAANSVEIDVTAGAPVNVALYRDDEEPIEHKCTCVIMKKDPDTNWNPTTWTLNRDNPARVLVGAGSYQIRRPGNLDKATGISRD